MEVESQANLMVGRLSIVTSRNAAIAQGLAVALVLLTSMVLAQNAVPGGNSSCVGCLDNGTRGVNETINETLLENASAGLVDAVPFPADVPVVSATPPPTIAPSPTPTATPTPTPFVYSGPSYVSYGSYSPPSSPPAPTPTPTPSPTPLPDNFLDAVEEALTQKLA